MTRSSHSKLHITDRLKSGRNYDISKESKYGESHNMAILKESDVIEILKSELPTKYFCDKFGVQRSVINKIRRRELWKCINI